MVGRHLRLEVVVLIVGPNGAHPAHLGDHSRGAHIGC